jgi:ubiquinone/menaquinone biosynthesis C-methylase UbiE
LQENNYWDDISSSYDKNYSSSWSLSEDREIAKILSSVRPARSPVRVLDLGCGTGLGFKIIHNKFANLEYIGIDASSSMLDQAKGNTEAFVSANTKIQLHHSDAMSALSTVGNTEFDIVLALNATGSYVAKTRPLFSECSRVLRPGGTALLSFLNRYSARRLLHHSPCAIKEQSVSRGEFQSSLSTPAVTLRKHDIISRLKHLQAESITLHYQSVLGGVWETDRSLVAERLIRKLAPSLGHTINVLFRARQIE